VDPETGCVLFFKRSAEPPLVAPCVLMPHAIHSWEPEDAPDPDTHSLEAAACAMVDGWLDDDPLPGEVPSDAAVLREPVLALLRQRCIPHHVDGDVITVHGQLAIRYPYTADACASSNEIVLQRIRDVLAPPTPSEPTAHDGG